MIVQSLLGEFLYEAENTRKLLQAIPDSALDYKPSEKNLTPVSLHHILLKYTTGTSQPFTRMYLTWPRINMIKAISAVQQIF